MEMRGMVVMYQTERTSLEISVLVLGLWIV